MGSWMWNHLYKDLEWLDGYYDISDVLSDYKPPEHEWAKYTKVLPIKLEIYDVFRNNFKINSNKLWK